MMSILFPSPVLLVGCWMWLDSTLEAATFLFRAKLSVRRDLWQSHAELCPWGVMQAVELYQ